MEVLLICIIHPVVVLTLVVVRVVFDWLEEWSELF